MAWQYEVQCNHPVDQDAYWIYFIRRDLDKKFSQVASITLSKNIKWTTYSPYSQLKPTIRISGIVIHKMTSDQAQEMINALTGISVPQPTVETP